MKVFYYIFDHEKNLIILFLGNLLQEDMKEKKENSLQFL